MKYLKYTVEKELPNALKIIPHRYTLIGYDAINHIDVRRDKDTPDFIPNLTCHLFSGIHIHLEGKEIVTAFLDDFESADKEIIDMTKDAAILDPDNTFECWSSSGDLIVSY